MQKRLTREESRHQTRTRLLDAAEQVFSRRGFNAASVEEVADKAGFSKGAVYSNFESKDDLFLALFDRRLVEEATQWQHIFSGQTSPAHRAEASAALITTLNNAEQAQSWMMLTLEFFLYAMRNEKARQKLAQRYQRIREDISKSMAEHFTRSGFEPLLSPQELGWLLPALNTGLQMQMQMQVEPGSVPVDLFRKVLRPFLDGLSSG